MSARPRTQVLLLGLALGLAAAFAPRLLAAPTAPLAKAEMNAHALAALMRARVPLVVLDARGAMREFIPTGKACRPDAPASTIARLAPSKKGIVVTYDGGTTQTSAAKLAERLARLGYQNVIRFPGGVAGWTKARYRLRKMAPVRPSGGGSGSHGSGSR